MRVPYLQHLQLRCSLLHFIPNQLEGGWSRPSLNLQISIHVVPRVLAMQAFGSLLSRKSVSVFMTVVSGLCSEYHVLSTIWQWDVIITDDLSNHNCCHFKGWKVLVERSACSHCAQGAVDVENGLEPTNESANVDVYSETAFRKTLSDSLENVSIKGDIPKTFRFVDGTEIITDNTVVMITDNHK